MRRRAAVLQLLWVVVAGACFDPTFKDDLACDSNGACPPGRTCVSGICSGGGGNAVDAPLSPGADAPIADARPGTVDARPTVDGAVDARPGPDGPPPECTTNPDCAQLTDDCNVGVCMGTMCAKMPANQGSDCGAVKTCGAFGGCGSFSDTCDSTGTRTRSCTTFKCASGSCAGTDGDESQPCSRTTENTSCGSLMVSNCDTCGNFDSTNICDESGTTVCTCTNPTCRSDVCTDVETACTRSCTRDTDGDECSVTDVGCPVGTIRDVCCRSGVCNNPCGSCT